MDDSDHFSFVKMYSFPCVNRGRWDDRPRDRRNKTRRAERRVERSVARGARAALREAGVPCHSSREMRQIAWGC